MKLLTDISATEAKALVGTTFYTLHGSGYGYGYGDFPCSAVREHTCVAIYSGQTQSGGIRLVNQDGERINPAIDNGIYTDLADVAASVLKGYDATIEMLRSRLSCLSDQIASTQEELDSAIALKAKIESAVGQPVA